MPTKTFIEAVRDTLADEMRRDESVIVLGEDVGKKGGVFLATDGLWGEFGDDRVIDTPLTESMIVGCSIGAALNGLRPGASLVGIGRLQALAVAAAGREGVVRMLELLEAELVVAMKLLGVTSLDELDGGCLHPTVPVARPEPLGAFPLRGGRAPPS